ncbi:MAG: DUF1922 domain-containing protein, partial [Methanomassiliicoccales archaeon]
LHPHGSLWCLHLICGFRRVLMLGVIICSKCRRARGVSLSCKKVRCNHCGKYIDVSKARVFHRTEDHEEIARAVQKINERMTLETENNSARKRCRTLPRCQASKADLLTEEGLRRLALKLSGKGGFFSIQDIMSELKVNEEGATEILARMLSEGIAYEPMPGVFRPLPP